LFLQSSIINTKLKVLSFSVEEFLAMGPSSYSLKIPKKARRINSNIYNKFLFKAERLLNTVETQQASEQVLTTVGEVVLPKKTLLTRSRSERRVVDKSASEVAAQNHSSFWLHQVLKKC